MDAAELSIRGLVRRPIRLLGALWLLLSPVACSYCVHDAVHPQAQQHTAFCAEYYKEGKLIEAEARCRLAREYAPKYAEPLNLLGLIEFSRGHLDKAHQLFKEAIALKADFAEAHNNLGAVFMDRREFQYASDAFRDAIEIDPGYVNARVNMAVCLFYQGKTKGATAEYRKCVELQPNACDCRQGLGVLAAKQKKYDDARTEFQKMTEVCPENPTGFYNLCQTYYDMGQCGNALEACMRAVALKSDYIEARKNLTAATECLSLEDGAIKEYTEKIRQNPGDAELHFNLGVVYGDKHLAQAALGEFLNAIKLNPNFAIAYYRAARSYDEILHTQETIDMCKEFVDRLRGDKYAEQRDWCVNRVKQLQYQ
jgi:tetratricopeptide (TPR) repeat protein